MQLEETLRQLEEDYKNTTEELANKQKQLREEIEKLSQTISEKKGQIETDVNSMKDTWHTFFELLATGFLATIGNINAFVNALERNKKTIKKWVDDIVGWFDSLISKAVELYNVLVGHSVIPDMWKKALEITRNYTRKISQEMETALRVEHTVNIRYPENRRLTTPTTNYITINLNVDRLDYDNYREIVDLIWREITNRVRYERGIYA